VEIKAERGKRLRNKYGGNGVKRETGEGRRRDREMFILTLIHLFSSSIYRIFIGCSCQRSEMASCRERSRVVAFASRDFRYGRCDFRRRVVDTGRQSSNADQQPEIGAQQRRPAQPDRFEDDTPASESAVFVARCQGGSRRRTSSTC